MVDRKRITGEGSRGRAASIGARMHLAGGGPGGDPSSNSSPPRSSSPSGSASSSESNGDAREMIRVLIREGAEARERFSAAMRELDCIMIALEAAEKRATDIKGALDAAELETAAAHIEAADAQALATGREEEVAVVRWCFADLEVEHGDLSRAATVAAVVIGTRGQLLPDRLRALQFHVRDLVTEGVRQGESNKGWHGDWFYIRNPLEAPFPEFHGGWPVRDLSWTWGTPTSEKFLAREIKEVIRKRVVEAGLNGATLFFTMRERRVMPLAERRMPMWLYSGPSNPDRAFAEELPEDDVYSWLMMVLKGADRKDFRVLASFDCKNPTNLGLGHPRSHPRLPGGPEGEARQATQQEAARKKKRKKGDRAVKREAKEREISHRAQHGEDRDKIREEYPSTSEAESSSSFDDGVTRKRRGAGCRASPRQVRLVTSGRKKPAAPGLVMPTTLGHLTMSLA
ncbi:hypothetical protein C2845_PM03G29740 [Panicum miliaceum]|uniref:Uncharacterized protein n=1 Tax=Panicum miliaceum TaxID=4540 RepID=A0A3L6T9S3_PANMI|nr:hypothetical protein C2845_PM03G29740 [Panicum miliaceum]